MIRALTALCALLTVGLVHAGAAGAEPPVVEQRSAVTISGDVHFVRNYTPEALRGCAQRTEEVTFHTPTGPQHHTYVGCPLDALITEAGPLAGESTKHPLLTLAIEATGADGYSAALSWADVAPDLAPRPALVAWSQDGVPLDAPRLVVPDDVSGARYVSDLTDLRVVQLDLRDDRLAESYR